MSAFRFQNIWINPLGYAMAGGKVYVCTQPASTGSIPPSPLASLFSDSAGSVPLANPVTVDANGNFFFYAASGAYTLVFFDPFGRVITPVVFPDMLVVSPGGGTVTSVGMTGDGVTQAATVPGSPVTSSGVLAPAAATANANTFVAGPSGGGAAALTQRTIVAADLPSATAGAKGAIQLAGDIGNTAASPQVVSTHLAAPLPINQGGFGAPSALGSISGTQAFNGANTNSWSMTLTGNITASTFTGGVAGMLYTFVIAQDGTGNRTFVWPTNFIGASAISPTANGVSIQTFYFDGTNARATDAGLTTPN